MSSPDPRIVDGLSIGEVAKLTGKAPSAIRYYEQLGLIGAPKRSGDKRRYSRDVVRTLAVIETAQRAGLSLEEIALLLAAPSADKATIERLRLVAEGKLPALRHMIERARIVEQWLEDAARCCCPSLDDCPLFDTSDHRLPANG